MSKYLPGQTALAFRTNCSGRHNSQYQGFTEPKPLGVHGMSLNVGQSRFALFKLGSVFRNFKTFCKVSY